MFSFEQLVNNTQEIVEDDVMEDYFTNFFTKENLPSYLSNETANEKQLSSIEEMFTSPKAILQRAQEIYEKDPYCLEAFYVIYRLDDEEHINFLMNEVYLRSKRYVSMDEYEKNSTIVILYFYVNFLYEIHNISSSIRVLKTIMNLEGTCSLNNETRLSYYYCLLEDGDNFYHFYHNVGFKRVSSYLLLIVTLLKHEDELKAKEVFSELLEEYPCAFYIDHVWDLDKDESDQAKEFYDSLDSYLEEICAVPYFFSWCSKNKEGVLKA